MTRAQVIDPLNHIKNEIEAHLVKSETDRNNIYDDGVNSGLLIAQLAVEAQFIAAIHLLRDGV